jgi:nitrogen fixation NifU-like protein
MYSARLLDHFENPRQAGELPEATLNLRQENPICGDVVELSASLREGHVIEIRFRAKGCVPAMACASAACELAQGKPLSIVSRITKEDVLSAVGGVPPASDHAAQLAVDALAKLVRQAAALETAGASSRSDQQLRPDPLR